MQLYNNIYRREWGLELLDIENSAFEILLKYHNNPDTYENQIEWI